MDLDLGNAEARSHLAQGGEEHEGPTMLRPRRRVRRKPKHHKHKHKHEHTSVRRPLAAGPRGSSRRARVLGSSSLCPPHPSPPHYTQSDMIRIQFGGGGRPLNQEEPPTHPNIWPRTLNSSKRPASPLHPAQYTQKQNIKHLVAGGGRKGARENESGPLTPRGKADTWLIPSFASEDCHPSRVASLFAGDII